MTVIKSWTGGIARPIPMKRELKVDKAQAITRIVSEDRKAHPDEKGTERLTRNAD